MSWKTHIAMVRIKLSRINGILHRLKYYFPRTNVPYIVIVPYTLRPHALPVPAVAHVYAESSLVYKLVVMKNRIAISDKLLLRRIDDQSHHCDTHDWFQSACHQWNTK